MSIMTDKQTGQASGVAARREMARRITREGAVLLKNDGQMLPLAEGTHVAVFGCTQQNTIKGGTGSAKCDCEYTVSLLDGIREAGLLPDETLAAAYRDWLSAHPIHSYGVWGNGMHSNPEMPLTDALLTGATEWADAAIVVLGRTTGENEDVALCEGDWYLSAEEKALLSAVSQSFPGRTAVLLNSGGLIDLSFVDTYGIAALLCCFMVGMEGARAIGELLVGRATPSGKLTSTVAYRYEDHPSAGHFGQAGGILQDYIEDVYVGYRYFLTLARDRIRYPFGFGLSYTELVLSDCNAVEENGEISVVCRVTNTGDRYAGREVVQVYASAPQPKDGAALYKPARVLAGFVKTRLLAPGESETVQITFPVSSLASFDDTGVTGHMDCFVLETGDYEIYVGTDCFADTWVFTHHQTACDWRGPLTHLGTSLPARLLGNGEMETLETIPSDPSVGIRIPADGETVIPATATATADIPIGKDLSVLAAGQSVSYRLIASVSGCYSLRFVGADGGRLWEYATLSLDGVPQTGLDAELSSPDGVEVILPTGTCELTLTAKRAFVPVTALALSRRNPVVQIAGAGMTRFSATSFVECSFGLNVRHFSDGGNGKPVSMLSNFWHPGKSVTYELYAEQAGIYDLTLRYANCKGDITLPDACALFVSNVGQTLVPVLLRHTCDQEDAIHLTDETAPVQIALPAGKSYLKLVAAIWQFPDLEYLTLTPSDQEMTVSAAGPTDEQVETPASTVYEVNLIEDDRSELPADILLADVADGRRTMEELVHSMSVDDLIGLVGGTPRNKNTIGVTGCICPSMLRYGIPPLECSDGPLGLRVNALTTAYPSGAALSSSWDPLLAEEFGRTVGEESVAYAVDIWLAPGVNLYRDPCCGRNFEYYSEDPLLSSRIAGGVVRGVQAFGTAVCVKHFAINNTEHERLKSDSRVSARAARELYLRNFEYILREADPWSVMSSYNHINGVKASEQHALITDIAHGEWGWDGIILSDWDNNSSHVRELLAGQDVKMSSGDPAAIRQALADGSLTRQDLESVVARILRMVIRTRAFAELRQEV